VTDGQTDRILIARPRLHSMQRSKNRKTGWSPFEAHSTTVCDSPHKILPTLALMHWIIRYASMWLLSNLNSCCFHTAKGEGFRMTADFR